MGAKNLEAEQVDRLWVSPQTLVKLYDEKIGTVYDWKHRPQNYTYPAGMIKKEGRGLKINVAMYENWKFKK